MERYICIHGHFYQPPRENPWLEAIELQDSAYPYHDWNETDHRRVLCAQRRLPTFWTERENRSASSTTIPGSASTSDPPSCAWLEEKAPEVYEAILAADRESQKNFSGHGSALAQAYNHMILPLANRRDKYTQILWGIRDFEHRFGRAPEGMWLPETAVDLETLDILADLGIRFTILSPHQAQRVRRFRGRNWVDVSEGGSIPPWPTSSGFPPDQGSTSFSMMVPSPGPWPLSTFWSTGSISPVAWPGLSPIAEPGPNSSTSPPTVRPTATTTARGHGAGLCPAIHRVQKPGPAHQLRGISGKTSPHPRGGDFREQLLELRPRGGTVAERLRLQQRDTPGLEPGLAGSPCGRHWTGSGTPWLLFRGEGDEFLKDPWAARDDYIEVILDRSPENVERFLAKACNDGR